METIDLMSHVQAALQVYASRILHAKCGLCRNRTSAPPTKQLALHKSHLRKDLELPTRLGVALEPSCRPSARCSKASLRLQSFWAASPLRTARALMRSRSQLCRDTEMVISSQTCRQHRGLEVSLKHQQPRLQALDLTLLQAPEILTRQISAWHHWNAGVTLRS